MSWLRIGDTAATDPRVLELHDPTDPLVGPAAWGFFMHLATLCAGQGTYDVAPGFVALAGGPAAPQLLKRCHRAGLLLPTSGSGRARRWRLIDDAPELLHIRLKAEVEWERQQRADTQAVRHQVAAYLRDGDSCRWCGVVVQPNDNRSGRGRTLDHVRPGQPARSADDLVVACRSCNGARGAGPEDADDWPAFTARWPMRQVPSPLIFRESTAAWLEAKGHRVPDDAVIVPSEHTRRRQPATTHTSRQQAGTDPARPATQAGAADGPSTTPSGSQHPDLQSGVATPGRADGRPHPGTQPGVAPPSLRDDTHPGSQPGVAASQEHQQRDRPVADRSVTDRSGTAAPGRVGHGSGSGTGRVAGPPPAPVPAPSQPPARAAPDPELQRTRRSRRRPRAAADPWT